MGLMRTRIFMFDILGFRVELTGEFSHRFAIESEFQRVMNNAVKNGIGEGGVLDFRMPIFDGKLRGKQTGCLAVSVIEEIEQFASVIGG